MKKITFLFALIGFAISSETLLKAQSFDPLSFCAPHSISEVYEAPLGLNNSKFKVALCSEGDLHPVSGCFSPQKNFILVYDKFTGRTIKLENPEEEIIRPQNIYVYKSKVNELTYQVAANSSFNANSWTSFSIFQNGRRTFHDMQYGNGIFGSC